MQKLNFPQYTFEINHRSGKLWIFDRIRKKQVVLTPEEWVRQHLLHFLVEERNCPRALIQVEFGISFNAMQRRVDVLVFDRTGKHWMVAECKAPDVKLTEESAMQVAQYNMSLRAGYILLTNGLSHYCFAADFSSGRLTALADIPFFS